MRELLREGKGIRFEARGASMSPAIRDAEIVHVKSVVLAELRRGDIVLVKGEMGFRLHRLVVADAQRDVYITRGDCGEQDDPAVGGEQILGVAVDKEVRVGRRNFRARFVGAGGCLLRGAVRGQRVAAKVWTAAAGGRLRTDAGSRAQKASRFALGVLGVLLVLLVAVYSRAQVAVDASTSSSAEYTGNATSQLSFAHTTTATGTNVLMLVGVSINITNSPTAGVVSITYGGAGFTFVGAHNDSGDTRRIEMWYLLAPATGTHNVHVNVNVPAAGQTVGVVAGATTFTGVDQTKPLGTFVSGDGAAGGYSQLDMPGVVNGMVMDTLATGGESDGYCGSGHASAAMEPGKRRDYAPPDVTRVGQRAIGRAECAGVGDVSAGHRTGRSGVWGSIRVSADIGVTTSVSAVPLGQNSTYTITVTNNGPSAANTVVLTDTYAATGLALVSVTSSRWKTARQPRPLSLATCGLLCQRSDCDDRGEGVDYDGGVLSEHGDGD